VFDNGCDNASYNDNALDLIPRLTGIDLVYFDPPYCDSHADYQSFYHLLETYTEYWKEKQFVNGTKRYEPKRYSGFDKKTTALESLDALFRFAQPIPYWIISYNDRSYPSIEVFVGMVSRYKTVSVERKAYINGRGGKGSVAGSNEVLLICK
jgi:adenine-specific DNA-methyltransferase